MVDLGGVSGVYIPSVDLSTWVLLGHGAPPVDSQPPTQPGAITFGTLTSDTIPFSWGASTDNQGVHHYEVRLNSGAWAIVPGGVGGRSFTMIGLSPSTAYTLGVSALDATGNRSTVRTGTATTLAGGGGGGVVATLMGMSDNGNPHRYSTWDSWRVYDTGTGSGRGTALACVALGAKKIGLTGGGSTTGVASTASGVRSFLNFFYGGPGTPTQHANIETHWANGNELDGDATTAANYFRNLADTFAAVKAVIADYPMASLWMDATQNNINSGSSFANSTTNQFLSAVATNGQRIGDMLDGLAGSYYPPHRNDYPEMTPASYTQSNMTPGYIVDRFITAAKTYGITRLSIWEVGIPVLVNDPIIRDGHTPAYPRPGLDYNDLTRRPTYMQALLTYWFDQCLANNLVPDIALYWDQQVNGSSTAADKGTPNNNGGSENPDNRLVNDNNLVSPDTATVWRNAPATYNATH